MTRIIGEKRVYWIGGTATALVGVLLARVLAPGLEGVQAYIVLGAGYVLAAAGLAVLACATRRGNAEAFVEADSQVQSRNLP